jgi:heme/copper-type cytochrome/quinol oxidase subunit 3
MDIKIPFNEELRPDTGLYNAKLGVWLFLASEVMLFGALFSAYVLLRVAAPIWDNSILNIPMATINTVVLITSSVTMIMSWVSLKMKNLEKYKLYMGLTILCSVIFLIIKYFEYSSKFEHGYYPSTNTFLAIYFTMTGLHMLHVLGGIIVNFYLWIPGAKMWETEPERFTNRIEIAGLYWHFVDLVWIFLFPALYLL